MSTIFAGTLNGSGYFSTIDFPASAPPRFHREQLPGPPSNVVVAYDDKQAAVGNWSRGGTVYFYDMQNPTRPQRLGSFKTGLPGIGAIAVDGNTVLVAENNGRRLMRIDFSTPRSPRLDSVITSPVPFGQNPSVALEGGYAVASSRNHTTVLTIDFTDPKKPIPGSFDPHLRSNPVTVTLEDGRVVVGAQQNDGRLKAFKWGTWNNPASVINTSIRGGFHSLSKQGSIVAAGSDNAANTIVLADLNAKKSRTFKPGLLGGCTVALDSVLQQLQLAVADRTGFTVKLFDVSNFASERLLKTFAKAPELSRVTSLYLEATEIGASTGQPRINLPKRIQFTQPVRAGRPSTQSFDIKNIGTGTLEVTSIRQNGPAFRISPTGSFKLTAGQNKRITVSFAPPETQTAVEQIYKGTLTVRSNAANGGTQIIPLQGLGTLPRMVAPKAVKFGTVPVCRKNATQYAVIQNTGKYQLELTSISTASPFTVKPKRATVRAGGSVRLTIGLKPLKVGQMTGKLIVKSDDPKAAEVTIPITGAATESPPDLKVSPGKKLDFPKIVVKEFVGRRLVFKNESPCKSLTVNLSIEDVQKHGAFTLTDQENPTTIPETKKLNFSVAPESNKGVVVFFNPGAKGAFSADLKIKSNDPDSPEANIKLEGTGITSRTPLAACLVLDHSASMYGAAPTGSKIDALKSTAALFVDLLREKQQDELATVAFNHQAHVLTPKSKVTQAQKKKVIQTINTLNPAGTTSIGAALQEGHKELKQSVHRKALLVFTDGKENVPPWIADAQQAILKDGVEIYAVGLGTAKTLKPESLNALAKRSSGKFFSTTDTLLLRKRFIQVLVDAFDKDMASDPTYTVGRGQYLDIPVSLTPCDHRIQFICAWDDPNEKLELELIAPDGFRYTPTSPATNRLVRYVGQPGYAFYELAVPPIIDAPMGIIGPDVLGVWTIRVSGQFLNSPQQRFITSVVVDSEIKMRARITPVQIGESPEVIINLLYENQPLSNALLKVSVTKPAYGMNDLLQLASEHDLSATLDPAFLDPEFIADYGYSEALLWEEAQPFLEASEEPQTFEVYAEQLGEDGPYSVTLPPCDVDGVYEVVIEAEIQACGGTVTRYAAYCLLPSQTLDPEATPWEAHSSDENPDMVHIVVTPRDQAGNLLGIGLASEMRFKLEDGLTLIGIDDLSNGSYELHLAREDRTSKHVVLALPEGELEINIPAIDEGS